MMLTASMVRMVKGAAASILLLLMTEPSGGNQEWIERYTSYTDKPVSQALAFLMETGMITRSGERGEYVYRLANGAQQLPLPVELLPDEGGVSAETTEPAPVDQTSPQCESENFRLDSLASSGFNQNLDSGDPPPDSRAASSEKFRANLSELDEHGIREPARSRLARLEHVTPRLIGYHCATAASPGQAIYRIEHNWRVPEGWELPGAAAEVADPLPAPDAPELVLVTVSAETLEDWQAAVETLASELSRADYETWVRSAWPAGMDGGTLVVGARNLVAATWLEQHIKRRLEELTGRAARIEVRDGPQG